LFGLELSARIHPSLEFVNLSETLRVFENRMIRGIFGPEMDEVTRGWRKLHDEELHGLYSSPSIIRVIKVRRMRWAGVRGAHGGGERCI
jgi:hypothetical protein